MGRSLDRMNVKVIGERMLRTDFQNRIQSCDDLLRSWLRLTFRRPLIPRPQVEHGFGKERSAIGILRMIGPDTTHCSRVGFVERAPILWLWIRVSLPECLNQITLDR